MLDTQAKTANRDKMRNKNYDEHKLEEKLDLIRIPRLETK